jgi:hypothetical protein
MLDRLYVDDLLRYANSLFNEQLVTSNISPILRPMAMRTPKIHNIFKKSKRRKKRKKIGFTTVSDLFAKCSCR